MKTKELRIGNLILFSNMIQPDKIIEVSGRFFSGLEKDSAISNYYSPIPLTEEWLLKFGFSTNDFNENCFWKNYSNQGEIILFSNKTPVALSNNIKEPFYFSFNNVIHGIKHVHQLQNLYFALTGEDLTIKE